MLRHDSGMPCHQTIPDEHVGKLQILQDDEAGLSQLVEGADRLRKSLVIAQRDDAADQVSQQCSHLRARLQDLHAHSCKASADVQQHIVGAERTEASMEQHMQELLLIRHLAAQMELASAETCAKDDSQRHPHAVATAASKHKHAATSSALAQQCSTESEQAVREVRLTID